LQDFEYEDDGDEEQDQDAGIENKYYTAKSMSDFKHASLCN